MLEMRPYGSLVDDIRSHLLVGVLTAEQHARLTYSCTTFKVTVEDVMLVGQILRILYC